MYASNFVPLLERLAYAQAAEDVVTGTECCCIDEKLVADWTVERRLFVARELLGEGG